MTTIDYHHLTVRKSPIKLSASTDEWECACHPWSLCSGDRGAWLMSWPLKAWPVIPAKCSCRLCQDLLNYYNNYCRTARILGPALRVGIKVVIRGHNNDQTAIPTDWDLFRINLENATFERERRLYKIFTMLLNTLLNKLVCAVLMFASRACQTVGISIDNYVEV